MANDEKKGIAQGAKTALKVIIGIALLAVGIGLVWTWRWEVLTVIKGFLGMVVILAGVILLAIAKE